METKSINNYEVQFVTIRELNDLRNKGLINADTAYQRGLTNKWLEPVFRGLWLDSIMQGHSTGVIMVNLLSDGTYELIDGKQRNNAIMLTLQGVGTFAGLDNEKLNQTFPNWGDDLSNQFLDYIIPLHVYRDLDASQAREIFERANAGIDLGAFEKRRGKLEKIITNAKFVELVNSVHTLMIKASAKITRNNSEEVLLQALSNIAFNNHNFIAKTYVELLQPLPVADLEKNLSILATNVNTFETMFNESDEDQLSQIKWMLKKSIISCMLCMTVDEFNFAGFSSFPKSSSDKEAGNDQKEFKKFNNNATASEVNVRGRIAILEKIQSGHATKNTAADPKEAKVAQPKTKKVELEAKKLTPAQVQEFKIIWRCDDLEFIKNAGGMILAWCEALNLTYVAPIYSMKSKAIGFEYRDADQKQHARNVSDIESLATITVKIEKPEAEAVVIEA
jgi:hypothetical protein